MTNDENSIFGHADIHCPYCWAELDGVEKYRNYFFYKFHVYEKIIALPIENPNDYFNLNWFGGINSFFPSISGDQKKIQIGKICPNCKRQYTLLVLPYETNIQERSRLKRLFNNLNITYTPTEYRIPADRFSFIFSWKSDWITFFISLWLILLLNGGLLLLIINFVIHDFDPNKQFIIDFFSLAIIQAIFIVIFKRHSIILNQFGKTDELPYLIHQNYINTSDFLIFKNLIDRGIIFTKKNLPKNLLFYTVIVIGFLIIGIISKFGITQLLSGGILNNPTFSFALSFFTFFLYFFVIGFVVAYFVLMSVFSLTIFTRSIPIKIVPLDKFQGIKLYEDFLFSSIILSLIISIIIPIVINIVSINQVLSGISASNGIYSTLVPLIQNGHFLYVLLTGIMIFLFPVILVRITSRNISSRKSEKLKEIIDRISFLQELTNPSIKDVLSIPVLLKEYEKTENMSEYPFNKILLLFYGAVIYLIPILISLI